MRNNEIKRKIQEMSQDVYSTGFKIKHILNARKSEDALNDRHHSMISNLTNSCDRLNNENKGSCATIKNESQSAKKECKSSLKSRKDYSNMYLNSNSQTDLRTNTSCNRVKSQLTANLANQKMNYSINREHGSNTCSNISPIIKNSRISKLNQRNTSAQKVLENMRECGTSNSQFRANDYGIMNFQNSFNSRRIDTDSLIKLKNSFHPNQDENKMSKKERKQLLRKYFETKKSLDGKCSYSSIK